MVKTRIKLSFIMLLALGCSFFASAELKFGFINVEEIFKNYSGTKDAQEKFDKEVAKWEQDASGRQKEIKDIKDQLEKQSLLLSSERKAELEAKLKQKMVEYQDFLQTKFGQKGEVLSKNEELTKPIVEKINKIIEKIAKDENYDFIMDARAGGVIYGKPAYDLTSRVLAVLNKEK
jgi:outer membrane protein